MKTTAMGRTMICDRPGGRRLKREVSRCSVGRACDLRSLGHTSVAPRLRAAYLEPVHRCSFAKLEQFNATFAQ
jgi:hypothetical protein